MKELFKNLSSVSNFFNEKRFIFGAEAQNPLEPPKFVEQGASDKELSDLMDKALGKDSSEKLADDNVQAAKKEADALFAKQEPETGLRGIKMDLNSTGKIVEVGLRGQEAIATGEKSGNRVIKGEEIVIEAGSSTNKELDDALQGANIQSQDTGSGLSGINLAGEQARIIAKVDRNAQGKGIQVAIADIPKK
jgi:hypothetical protein